MSCIQRNYYSLIRYCSTSSTSMFDISIQIQRVSSCSHFTSSQTFPIWLHKHVKMKCIVVTPKWMSNRGDMADLFYTLQSHLHLSNLASCITKLWEILIFFFDKFWNLSLIRPNCYERFSVGVVCLFIALKFCFTYFSTHLKAGHMYLIHIFLSVTNYIM